MLNEIITVYAITDDLLKAIEHHENCRRGISNAEIMTTALIAAIFFNGNHSKDYRWMKDNNLILKMLYKLHFCINYTLFQCSV